jgi:hypothetical protein
MTGQTRDGDRTGETDERWRPVTRRTVEPNEQTLRTAIVSAVADAEGVDPAELSSGPLSDDLDVDALDESFFGLEPEDVPGDVAGVVEFRYGEYRVTVSTDGDVDVAAPADGETSGA